MKIFFQDEERKKVVWFSAFALLIAISPLLTKLCINGHDLEYHLLRIESLKEGILMGRPFLKVNVLFFGGAGYASSMFYPDFLLYIPALLRFLGVSINTSYHIFAGICVILCYFSTFYCARLLTHSDYGAMITAVMLTLCNYHLEDLYVRAAVGEYTAFIFVPFVLYGIYNALFEGADRVYLLGIGYGGVLLCHTGTFILCLVFGLVSVFWRIIASFLSRGKDRTEGGSFGIREVFRIALTAVLTAGLTSFYWLPLMEQLFSQTFYVSRPWIKPAQEARQFSEVFFSGFPSLGAILILLYLFRVLIPKTEKTPLLSFSDMLYVIGVVFALCSTDLFPWVRLGPFMSFMQFPWRFFLMSSLCLAFSDGIVILTLCRSCYEKQTALFACLILLVFSLTALWTMEKNAQGYYDYSDDYYSYTPFTANVIAGEWLPVTVTDRDALLDQCDLAIGSDGKKVSFTRDKNALVAQADRELSYIDVPFIYYKGYGALLSETEEGKQPAELFVDGSGENGLTRVHLPQGMRGEIRVSYQGTPAQRISLWISLGSAVVSCFFLLLRRKGGKRTEKGVKVVCGSLLSWMNLVLILGFLGISPLLCGCAGDREAEQKPDPESLKEIEELLSGKREEAIEEEEESEPVTLSIRLAGRGFLPGSNKSFMITVSGGEKPDLKDLGFFILDSEGKTVYQGELTEREADEPVYDEVPGDEPARGDGAGKRWYYTGDFTDFSEEGSFYVGVFSGEDEGIESELFEIKENYYSYLLTEKLLALELELGNLGQQDPSKEKDPGNSLETDIVSDLLLSYEFFDREALETGGKTSICPKSLELSGKYLELLWEKGARDALGNYLLAAVSAMYAKDIADYDRALAGEAAERAEEAFLEAEAEEAKAQKAGEEGADDAGDKDFGYMEGGRFWAASQLYKYKNEKKYRILTEELAARLITEETEEFERYSYLGEIAYLTTINKVDTELSEALMNQILSDAAERAKEIRKDAYWIDSYWSGEDYAGYFDPSEAALDQARCMTFANTVSESVLYVRGAEELYGYFGQSKEGPDAGIFVLNGLNHSYITGKQAGISTE